MGAFVFDCRVGEEDGAGECGNGGSTAPGRGGGTGMGEFAFDCGVGEEDGANEGGTGGRNGAREGDGVCAPAGDTATRKNPAASRSSKGNRIFTKRS